MVTVIMGIATNKLHDTVDERCTVCFLETYRHLFEKFNVNEVQREKYLVFFSEIIIPANGEM